MQKLLLFYRDVIAAVGISFIQWLLCGYCIFFVLKTRFDSIQFTFTLNDQYAIFSSKSSAGIGFLASASQGIPKSTNSIYWLWTEMHMPILFTPYISNAYIFWCLIENKLVDLKCYIFCLNEVLG